MRIIKRRPQTPTTEMVFTEMNLAPLKIDDTLLFKECFPTYYAKHQESEARVAREAEKAVKEATREAEKAVKEAEKRTEEAVKKAKKDLAKVTEEASRREAEATSKLKLKLVEYIKKCFPNKRYTALKTMIAAIDNYYDADAVFDLCLASESIEEMTEKVQDFFDSKNKR